MLIDRKVKSRLIKLIILLILFIVIFTISVLFTVSKNDMNIENICRVLVSEELNDIKNGKTNQNFEYKYTIFDLDGMVVKTEEENIDKKYDIQNILSNNYSEVSGNIFYVTELCDSGKVSQIVRFVIPNDKINSYNQISKIYIFIDISLFVLILICIYRIYRMIKKDILIPINELHKSAKAILKGNYSQKVSYDYYGEIGEFSRDFESMREELIEASNREKKAKVAEKELLACISHDLKTPIANIIGYCEGINDGVVQRREDINKYVSIVLKKARVLNKLLDDILDLSKAEINKMSINKKEIYTREFFESLLEEISIDVYSKKRKLIVNGSIPDLLLNLDEERIVQAINNIINNSIKYTKEDGVISISFQKIEEGMVINIQDNGIGIASEDIPFVFNKFYRSEKHRNQNIPGSGLGLSIAKYIIEMHNGNIQIESNKEIGTLVTITIRN